MAWNYKWVTMDKDIRDIIENICNKNITRFRSVFIKEHCELNHREVTAMKETVEKIDISQEALATCVRKKFTKLYFLLTGTLIALTLNLVYMIIKSRG